MNLGIWWIWVNLGELGGITVHRGELRLIGMNCGICGELGFNLGEFWWFVVNWFELGWVGVGFFLNSVEFEWIWLKWGLIWFNWFIGGDFGMNSGRIGMNWFEFSFMGVNWVEFDWIVLNFAELGWDRLNWIGFG